MTRQLTLRQCQARLLWLWLAGCFPPIVLLVTRSLGGRYEGAEDQLWSWFLPLSAPVLTLQIGVYGALALQTDDRGPFVDPTFFRVTVVCSIIYLLALNATVVVQPFLSLPATRTLMIASLYLGPLQGLATGCLGVLFVRRPQP